MGMQRWLGLSVVVGLVMTTGCSTPSEESRERLAVLEAEAEELDAVLDSVEERLLGNQAMLQTWQELGRRHQEVTQLHCQTSEPHILARMKHYEKMEERVRQTHRRSSVAAVDPVLTSGKSSKSQHGAN
ncbi:hypothetical protein LXT21_29990 [Myxococcus sp. K38C18041901]|nr:hypothetical protein [Myxococcus guangdongensis]